MIYNIIEKDTKMNELNKDLKNMAYQLINSASPDSDSYTVGFPLDISEIFIEVRPNGNAYNEMS